MAVQHMVWFKFHDGVTPERIAHHMRALQALHTLVPGIRLLKMGANFTDRARGFTHGLLVTFDSRASLQAYSTHPSHVAVATAIRAEADVMAMDFDHDDG